MTNDTPNLPNKIVRRKLSEEVFDRLLLVLDEEGYQPGDRLPSERDLMKQFGVGRPAVREALQTLESHGLITIIHGERARVARPNPIGVISKIEHVAHRLLASSPDSLEHFRQARVLFELGVVREAAEQATDADVARLNAAHDVQTAKLGDDPAEFVAADMAFHTAIASITGNPILEAGSAAILNWLSHFHAGILHWAGNEQQTLAEHEEIIAAIAANDADEAVEAMRVHLLRTRSVFRTDAGRR